MAPGENKKEEDFKVINEKVLKALKEEMESHYVRSIEDIDCAIKVFKSQDVFVGDDINFRIHYIPKTESYRLETSFSNQVITKEWIDKLNRIRKIIRQA